MTDTSHRTQGNSNTLKHSLGTFFQCLAVSAIFDYCNDPARDDELKTFKNYAMNQWGAN